MKKFLVLAVIIFGSIAIVFAQSEGEKKAVKKEGEKIAKKEEKVAEEKAQKAGQKELDKIFKKKKKSNPLKL